MALYLFIVCTSVKGASLIFIIIAWKAYKPPQKTETVVDKAKHNSYIYDGNETVANGVAAKSPPPAYDMVENHTSTNTSYGDMKENGIVSPVYQHDDELTRF